MNNILSGEQLVQAHSKTSHELPSAGVKEFEPSHSWLEGKQVQSALDERKALLEEERVEKWSSLMGAEWQLDRGKARVTRLNRHWEVFGHHSDSDDWLFPEEALFLLETNCLECLFNEVPLSVQKAYSVLLGETNGCSLTEYRVFSHLCRAGYRVVRHLPDLTVTAYERRIRLDQHLSERKTYGDAAESLIDKTADTSIEETPPRPDLPPKKILELEERTEVMIKSQSSPDGVKMDPEVSKEKQASQSSIEVIDLLDSDETSEEEQDSSDSDVEIIQEFTPRVKIPPEEEDDEEEEDEDEDNSDVEIVEVPSPKKRIVVATIDSSESEDEEESDSDSDKSCDGNWKRRQSRNRRRYVRPPNLSHFKYLTVEEFCVEFPKDAADPDAQPLPSNGGGDFAQETCVLSENSNSVEFLSLDVPSTRSKRTKFKVDKTRNEILDMIPTMAGYKRKLMTIESADLRLIPESVRPKHDSYTYNTNTLRARIFSTFRGGYRGRRNFRAPIFNNFSPYYNPDRNMQANFQPLAQMFGNDVHSVATGMMQFASSLLMNNQNNGSVSYHSPRHALLPSPGFGSVGRPSPEERFRNMFDIDTPVHTRFSDSPVHTRFTDTPFTSERESQNWYLRNQSFESDSSFNSSYDGDERAFMPTGGRSSRGRGGRFRRPMSREAPPFTPSPSSFRAITPAISEVDPAYARPDVPLVEDTSGQIPEFIAIPKSSNHGSIKKENSVEIINLTDDVPVPGLKSISNRFVRKRTKQMKSTTRKKMRVEKSKEHNKSVDIIFLDDPSVSNETLDTSNVKQETNGESSVTIKSEAIPVIEESVVKQEGNESTLNAEIKTETIVGQVKTESSKEEVRVKSEESNNVRVKVEQDQSGENVHVEIKIESSSDTSSVSSLPVAVAVMKTETGIKTEPEISNDEVSSSSVKIEQEKTATIKDENREEENEEPDSSQNSAVITNEESSSTTKEGDSRVEMEVEDSSVNISNPSENNKMLMEEDESQSVKVSKDLNVEPTSSCVETTKPEDKMNVEVSTSIGDAEITQDKCISQEESKEINDKLNISNPSENNKMLMEEDESQSVKVSEDLNVEQTSSCVEMTKPEDKMDVEVSTSIGDAEITQGKCISQEESKEINESDTTRTESSALDTNLDCLMKANITDDRKSEISTSVKSSVISNVENNEDTSKPSKVSSWADVKKHNVPLTSLKEVEDGGNEGGEEDSDEDVDEDDIRPLLRPKNCKTIGTVLSALQIFCPFSPKVSELLPKLKISFDVYLSADFRKSQRGLPHFRVVVFGGADPIPSPAQLHELQHRFEDSVPILRAVVTPGSVVCYSCVDVSLPVDVESYRK